MEYEIFPERRRNERRKSNPAEDILCRRVFGDRRRRERSATPAFARLSFEAQRQGAECDNLICEPGDPSSGAAIQSG